LQVLNLSDPGVLEEASFLDAVKENRSVMTVIVGKLVVERLPESQLCQLLECIGEMESLEAIEVNWSELQHTHEQKRLHGRSLCRFLHSAKRLKTLVLWPFLLFSSKEEIESVADALRGHATLQQVAWMNILLTLHMTIDPILHAFASIPHLNTLQLAAGCRIQQGSQLNVLHNFDFASRLTSLALRNFGLTDEHCILLAQTLTQQPGTLKVLDLRFNSIEQCGFESLDTMLKDNFVIEWLETDKMPNQLLDQVNFALLLNRAGRFRLLKEPRVTVLDAIEVFLRTENNLDAIYVLLRQSPFVCNVTDKHKELVPAGEMSLKCATERKYKAQD
jgi:hypothetical protein